MKKLLIIFCLVLLAAPVFADIVNPNLTKEEQERMRANRLEAYNRRYRMSVLNKACSKYIPFQTPQESSFFTEENLELCRAAIQKEAEKNIQFLNQYVEERKNNDNKNLKNASKQ